MFEQVIRNNDYLLSEVLKPSSDKKEESLWDGKYSLAEIENYMDLI